MIEEFKKAGVKNYGIIVLRKTGLEITSPLIAKGLGDRFRKNCNRSRAMILSYFEPVLRDIKDPRERAAFMAIIECVAVRESLGFATFPKTGLVVPMTVSFSAVLPPPAAFFAAHSTLMVVSCALTACAYWVYIYRKKVGNFKLLFRLVYGIFKK